jgi:DNA adenine methylase
MMLRWPFQSSFSVSSVIALATAASTSSDFIEEKAALADPAACPCARWHRVGHPPAAYWPLDEQGRPTGHHPSCDQYVAPVSPTELTEGVSPSTVEEVSMSDVEQTVARALQEMEEQAPVPAAPDLVPPRPSGHGGPETTAHPVVDPRPICKAAGGKTHLLPELEAVIPATYRRYYEPFVGGGALFFRLASQRESPGSNWATLVDNNPRLIRCYRGVRDDVEGVIRQLDAWPTDRDTYDSVRQQDVDSRSDTDVAAWFLYLNKNCYNGLYRVNRKGAFNTPYGRYKPEVRRHDYENLRAVARLLQGITIEHGDYAEAMRWAGRGDLVYCDPPYLGTYAAYTQEKFGQADHVRLRTAADRARARGAHVVVSNSAAAAEIWSGWTIRPIVGRQSVSRGTRGAQAEILITPP